MRFSDHANQQMIIQQVVKLEKLLQNLKCINLFFKSFLNTLTIKKIGKSLLITLNYKKYKE